MAISTRGGVTSPGGMVLDLLPDDPELTADDLLGAEGAPTSDWPRPASRGARTVALAVVVLPMVAGGIAIRALWDHGVGWFDLVLALCFYVVTGFGITVGFHRLLAHRSFLPRRWLKVLLAVAGSMAIQGSVISWVSQHRRHHAFSDRPGDPHSPATGASPHRNAVARLWHAHAGWLFRRNAIDAERWSPDLMADRDIARVSRNAPLWVVVSLAAPFLIGLAVTRSFSGAFLAFVWAGAIRMACLHHSTWSINSLCHMFGRRPYRTREGSRNLPALALVSFGESWHNSHHAFPGLPRHGVDPGQIDMSAGVIRIFERLGLVSEVRWPTPALLARRRDS